jgi:hypothetical protein
MKMKHIIAVTVGLSLLVPRLYATQVNTPTGSYGPYQVTPGGEFTLHTTDATLLTYINTYYAGVAKNQLSGFDTSFQSFCVEGAENIATGMTYDVVLDTATKFGNKTLTAGAAWLYAEFATGNLVVSAGGGATAGYDYSAGISARKLDAPYLQNAIWAFMGQQGKTATTEASNPYFVLAQASVVPLGFTSGFADNSYSVIPVEVLQLWEVGHVDESGYARQDQLILTREYRKSVPDGGLTVGLMGLALTGLGVLRRRYPQA